MQIGNLMIMGRVVLAPMAGVTDIVFRRLCRRFGAAIVYSEFLSTDGLVYNTMNQEHKLILADDEHPVAYQLFGARTETFATAARQLAMFKPDMIDLNFGCPVKKVVGKNGGAAILKDLTLMAQIVHEASNAVSIPVTVKMRAGWDHDNLVYHDAAHAAVAEGAQAVTLHARTRVDGYETAARWSYIADLKRSLNVPVIGNGDVDSPEDARLMLEQTGCDAVMIGRGALGRPWLFAQINHFLETGDLLPEPCIRDRICVALRHLNDKLAESGNDPGVVRLMRKQLAAYLKGWTDSHALKARLMSATDPGEIRNAFNDYLAHHPDLPRTAGDDWIAGFVPLDYGWLSTAAA